MRATVKLTQLLKYMDDTQNLNQYIHSTSSIKKIYYTGMGGVALTILSSKIDCKLVPLVEEKTASQDCSPGLLENCHCLMNYDM